MDMHIPWFASVYIALTTLIAVLVSTRAHPRTIDAAALAASLTAAMIIIEILSHWNIIERNIVAVTLIAVTVTLIHILVTRSLTQRKYLKPRKRKHA